VASAEKSLFSEKPRLGAWRKFYTPFPAFELCNSRNALRKSADLRQKCTRYRLREDFGYGWTLGIKQGSVQHNRQVGDGFSIYTSPDPWAFPCQETFEQKSHYTLVHLSEKEAYVFRPRVINGESIAGGCRGQVLYEYVEGWTKGATLEILGNVDVQSGGFAWSEQPTTPPWLRLQQPHRG